MSTLTIKGIWNGPGYRDLVLDLVDEAGREHQLQIRPAEMQRVINACADAVSQIGTEPPIDWDRHPTQIYWPTVTPWRRGPSPAKAEGKPQGAG